MAKRDDDESEDITWNPSKAHKRRRATASPRLGKSAPIDFVDSSTSSNFSSNASTLPAIKQQPFFPFLKLPNEIHLIIYEYCTAFTLLQIYNTSRFVREELDNHHSIVRHFFGYFLLPHNRQKMDLEPEESMRRLRQPSLDNLAEGKLESQEEYELFQQLYPSEKDLYKVFRNDGWYLRRRYRYACCEACWRITPNNDGMAWGEWDEFTTAPAGEALLGLWEGVCWYCKAQRTVEKFQQEVGLLEISISSIVTEGLDL
ncbi:hypothetical protein BJ508DRAFT_302390 [Ascobolus immersus RN42]|uniref:F-box domain-containing protein n=1 Tax=Ascobolus immersus RN42 TaxID=1160509 RepID=A0A3N4IPA0_ASCIM|nr:hypothetical protein BJ508DRAFT_302390 [Ascobolus immersus RN42]